MLRYLPNAVVTNLANAKLLKHAKCILAVSVRGTLLASHHLPNILRLQMLHNHLHSLTRNTFSTNTKLLSMSTSISVCLLRVGSETSLELYLL